jgi:Xaa-Pro aminopeptidase
VTAEAYDEPLTDGRAFLIDAVSHLMGYHGDFARTVFLGEPPQPMRRVTTALAAAWDEIRANLKPGLRFSQIRAQGPAILKKLGYDFAVGFTPHHVGLWHTDQPRANADGSPFDPVLEPGMIISVDCPLVDTGLGGTAHLEDLTLITADGARPIHETGEPVIMV